MSTKPQRATVRAGALDRTLEAFNSEIGYKVGKTMDAYHALHVAPLERRVAEMERWTVRYWWSRALSWAWGPERVG